MSDKDVQGKAVLGIHSAIGPDPGNSAERFMDGHAWLSMTVNGKTQYYGLWPDGHPLVTDNGAGTDIRTGLEAKYKASASRYYELSPEQLQKFNSELKENVTWTPTTTCAGWASDTVKDVTGQRIDATEFLIIQTPRQLIDEIRKLEQQQPTAPLSPTAPADQRSSSSFFGAVDDGRLTIPAALVPLHEQSVAAVQRLDMSKGPSQGAAADRLAHSVTHLAAANGLSRIDQLLLSEARGEVGKAENLFVLQGDPGDPAQHRVTMKTQDALDTPVEQSLVQLQALGEAQQRKVPIHAMDDPGREISPQIRMG